MKEFAEDLLHVIDADQRRLGTIKLEQIDDGLLFGAFTPGPDFPAVAAMFQKFEQAVNAQALSVVDKLDAEIAALGLRLCLSNKIECIKIHDVQIWSDGNFTCRLADAILGDSLWQAFVNGQPLEMAHLQLQS
jgi:hypothetical protein